MVDRAGNWYADYPGQRPEQDPAFVRFYGPVQQQNNQNQQAAQMLTPPTIHAEIVQVDDLSDMDRFRIKAGDSQMFMTKDERIIAIRNMYGGGQHSDMIYDLRPPEPPAPTINPQEYVRRDELGELLAAAIREAQAHSPGKEAA